MTALTYSDGLYEVEMYDRVDIRLPDGSQVEGEVRNIHPRLGAVTVRYEDHNDTYRTTSNPRRKSARVPVADVDLIGRDA